MMLKIMLLSLYIVAFFTHALLFLSLTGDVDLAVKMKLLLAAANISLVLNILCLQRLLKKANE